MAAWRAKRIKAGKAMAAVPLPTLRRLLRSGKEVAPPKAYRDKVVGPCWTWRGHCDPHGYGQIKVGGRAQWVHRVSYQACKGDLKDGNEVDHMCHNHGCFNPAHLRRRGVSGNRGDTTQGGVSDDTNEDMPF